MISLSSVSSPPLQRRRFMRLIITKTERKSPVVHVFSMCSTSKNKITTTTDQLRTQLDQLHSEAHQTRAKANNARLRLLRLSEAAENLRRQAAVGVGTGKEEKARELLLQKKKVMQALEKSKTRVELLDRLSAKLNEAISVKETQLIGNVALDFEIGKEDTSSPIRIVSPKEGATEIFKEELLESDNIKFSEDQVNVQADYQKGLEELQHLSTVTENDRLQNLHEISSYREFLENLDRQFHDIEIELSTILRLSTIIMETDQKQQNPRVKQTIEILEDVCGIRSRIASIMQQTSNES